MKTLVSLVSTGLEVAAPLQRELVCLFAPSSLFSLLLHQMTLSSSLPSPSGEAGDFCALAPSAGLCPVHRETLGSCSGAHSSACSAPPPLPRASRVAGAPEGGSAPRGSGQRTSAAGGQDSLSAAWCCRRHCGAGLCAAE